MSNVNPQVLSILEEDLKRKKPTWAKMAKGASGLPNQDNIMEEVNFYFVGIFPEDTTNPGWCYVHSGKFWAYTPKSAIFKLLGSKNLTYGLSDHYFRVMETEEPDVYDASLKDSNWKVVVFNTKPTNSMYIQYLIESRNLMNAFYNLSEENKEHIKALVARL